MHQQVRRLSEPTWTTPGRHSMPPHLGRSNVRQHRCHKFRYTTQVRITPHILVVPWQAAFLAAALVGATLSGLGPRIWLLGAAVLLGAVAHVKWHQRRGLPPHTLAHMRQTTLLSAGAFACTAGGLSLATSTAATAERVIVAVGASLITAFAVGVLTLCGLSLGAGSEQPVTKVLPDPAHPGRPRRPAQRPRRSTPP